MAWIPPPTVSQSDRARGAAEKELPDVGLLLRAALEDHGDDLDLAAGVHLDLHELVTRLLEIQGAHDGQVDRTPAPPRFSILDR